MSRPNPALPSERLLLEARRLDREHGTRLDTERGRLIDRAFKLKAVAPCSRSHALDDLNAVGFWRI